MKDSFYNATPLHAGRLLIVFVLLIIAIPALAIAESIDYVAGDNKKIQAAFHEAQTLHSNGKTKKAINVLEAILPASKSSASVYLLEKNYELLLTYSNAINNKKRIEEYSILYNLIKTRREKAELERKTRRTDALITKSEKERLEVHKELIKKDSELLFKDTLLSQTRDSLNIMDLINSEKESQIALLNKENELKELKVIEQDLLIKEQEAKQRFNFLIMVSLSLGLLGAFVLAFFIYKNFKQKKTYGEKIKSQLDVIQHQHESISSSINYAQRIQSAMLPTEKQLYQMAKNSFVLFKPKDVVSGDFYWFYNLEGSQDVESEDESQKVLIAAVDCTGHGVPGAFMSMIGYNLLNMIAHKNIHAPDRILGELHKNVRYALQQHNSENNDGMDMSLCLIDKSRKVIEFAGAKNTLIVIKDGEIETIKGDKNPIGGSQGEIERIYTKHTIPLDKPTTIYLFTDGYEDQFGGPDNRKFMIKNLRELLLKIHQEPFEKQKEILDQNLENWKGDNKQIDDILVMGMRIE